MEVLMEQVKTINHLGQIVYQGKTMNFTPLRSGGVLLEVY